MSDFKTWNNGTHTNDRKFFNPKTKQNWEGFSSSAVKSTITVNRKVNDVIVPRDILGALVATSHKGKSPVDIDKSLSFNPWPGPVSQPLVTADNKKRKTSKSKLYDVEESVYQNFNEFAGRTTQYLIYDLAATLRRLKYYALKRYHIPQQYDTVYVVCYT